MVAPTTKIPFSMVGQRRDRLRFGFSFAAGSTLSRWPRR